MDKQPDNNPHGAALRLQILLFMAVLMIVIGGFIALVWMPRTLEVFHDRHHRSVAAHLQTAGDNVLPFMLNNQISGLYEALDLLRERQPDMRVVELYNETGKRLYPLMDTPIINGQHVETLSEGIEYRGQSYGRIVATVDFSESFADTQKNSWLLAGVIGGGMIAAMVMVIVFLNFRVARPVRRLSIASQRLADGDYAAPLPEVTNDEIGALTASFTKMRNDIHDHDIELRLAKDIAERANLAKSKFLSSMSHELRTPLNAVLGFAQVLEISQDPPLSEQQLSALEQISKGGGNLLNLINAILDLSTIETGELTINIESADPVVIIADSLIIAQPIADQHGITVHDNVAGQDLPMVHCDPARTHQVLQNLLSNAIKYNKENGMVRIDAACIDDSVIRITISDSGPGIEPSLQEYIFEPFNRLGRENMNIEGTGIGLTICKKLIDAMDGRIGFESVPDKGCAFWIELPLSPTFEKLKAKASPQ